MRQKDSERIDALQSRLSDVERANRSTRQSHRALFEAVVRCLKTNPEAAKGQRVVFIMHGHVDVGRVDEIEEDGGGAVYTILTEHGLRYAREVYVIDPS